MMLAGLFSQAVAQLPSNQPPSALVARYKEKLDNHGQNNLPSNPLQAAPENLPSAQPVSVKAIEARIKKKLPVAAIPAGPAAAPKLPSNAPPPKVRKPPPLPGN